MRNYFDVLGVPQKFHLHADELEKQFLTLSKQYHPDRFAKAPPHERLQAVQRTTELNDAYKVLRDPVRRAEYLCKLHGLDVADEKIESVKASPELLAEMMELNEQLDDARGDREVAARLADLVKARRATAMQAVEVGFRAVDDGDRALLGEIAQSLIAMRYHARFLEQAEAAEEDQDLRGGL
jgi:molecular chaperone HscB